MAKFSKLEHQARSVIGKNWSKSSATRNELLQNVSKIADFMRHQGLNDIHDMKTKHCDAYMNSIEHLSEGRMANHATALRTIADAIGKPDIVRSNADYGCDRNIENRTQNQDVRLDAEKYEEVKQSLSPAHQIAYEMSREFGLRQRESLRSHEVVERDGKQYLVVEGAKGGRPREIEIVNERQVALLERNNAYRETNDGKLADSSRNLAEAIKDYQNDLHRAGATRESHANTHSCRREYIIERCEAIKQVSCDETKKEMLEHLVEEIGHGRTEVLSAYASVS